MKKFISLLLVVLTVFSLSTVAFAADEEVENTVTVHFEYNLENGDAEIETISVAYGVDLDEVAPKAPDFVHPNDSKTKMFFSYWTTNHKAYEGEQLTNLPVIGATDGITEITFEAYYEPKENNVQNNIQGAVDDFKENLPGAEVFEGMDDFFTAFIDLIKNWFMQIVLYINAFLPKA